MDKLFRDKRTRLGSILFLALLIRLIGIAIRPIWYDEAFSILFSEKGLGQMIYGTLAPSGAGSADIHPLGYYTLLWGWMKVFGNSLSAARMLSVLAGLVTVYLVYRIAQDLFDTKMAETSAFVVALAPYQVHYAQEIRMYSLLAMWLLLAVYSYIRGSMGGGWQWWTAFGVSSALAQYTHNLAAFFLIPLALTPLLTREWRQLRSVTISGLFAIFLYLPWLVQLPSQLAKVDQSYWVSKPDISRFFTLLLVFTTNTPLPDTWVLPALTIAIFIAATGIIQTVRMNSGSGKTNGLWVLYLAIAPPLLLFLFSQWTPIYIERALLPSGAFFCIWLAWVLIDTKLASPGRNLMTALLAVVFAAGIHQHFTYRGFPYGPFKEMTDYLRESSKPGDAIVHSNKLSMLPALYFDPHLAQTFIGDPPGSATDTLAPATQRVLGIKAEPDIRSATYETADIWYVIYQRSIDEYIQSGRATHPDIEYLDAQFSLVSRGTWDGLQILHYEKVP